MSRTRPSTNAGSHTGFSVPLTSFIGREEDIGRVCALLLQPEVRLLTITGTGGIGKTRLALQVAVEVRNRFADGLTVVPLASVRDPALVPVAMVQALSVPDDPTLSAFERIARHLADREQFLLLDNLEHLPDAAHLVAELLAVCPRVTVLATSRVRLGISGEHVFPVGALDPESARELFAARAAAVAPGFAVTDENAAVLDAICARLDGLPLAIELAAARILVLSPPALLAKLDHRLDLLRDGPRDAPSRLRDMRGAISWSYDLLTDDQQQVFRTLGVFVGGFTLKAVKAVAATNADPFRHISSLVEASLVVPIEGVGDEPRFTMLETIREFAVEQLATKREQQDTRRRHAVYYQNMAEDALPHYDGPELFLYNARVDRELDNCRAAMSWCLETGAIETGVRLAGALWRVWWYGLAAGKKPWWDRRKEGREWCMRMLAAEDGLPVEAISEAVIGAAFLGRWVIDYPQLIKIAEDLLARTRAADYPYGQWWALHLIGTVLVEEDQVAAAVPYLQESRDIAPRVRNPENHLSMSLCWLGEIAERAGELDRAATLYGEALEHCRISRNPAIISQVTHRFGAVCRVQGRFREAIRYFLEAATVYGGQHDSGGQQAILLEVALVAEKTMDVELAARLLGAAAAIEGHEVYRETFVETTSRMRSKLDEATFEAAWQAGHAMTWADVVTLIESLIIGIEAEEQSRSRRKVGSHGLTPRETEVLGLIAEGRTNRSIAETLSLSERTVENHVLHLLTKLGLESRTAAAAWAIRQGMA